MKAASQAIVGKETNPLLKARRIYTWIAENFMYSFAHEYSTIRNISDFCLRKGYGDCGQHTLLFITLCRLNGIPARWQSGWYTFPGAKTIHDWAEIYLAPYGWIPVDVDMGVFAHRYFTSLTPEERQRLKEFFFGGLDQYRIAANADHSQTLEPPKRFYQVGHGGFPARGAGIGGRQHLLRSVVVLADSGADAIAVGHACTVSCAGAAAIGGLICSSISGPVSLDTKE